MILWTALTWILTLSLLPIMGFNAVAVALLAITSTVALVVILVKRVVSFSFFGSVRIPVFAATVQFIISRSLIFWFGSGLFTTAIAESTGVILFGVVLVVFEREKIGFLWDHMKQLWKR